MEFSQAKVSGPEAESLAKKLRISIEKASVLIRRGIVAKHNERFFVEGEPEALHSPFIFSQMERFCSAVAQAQERHERVFVFGDRDADGITSTALIVKYLRSIGFGVDWSVPEGDDPYGFTMAKVDAAIERGCKFIISVDCGITLKAEIDHALEKGCTFAVLDHHLPSEPLDPRVIVLNPEGEGPDFPSADLSAAGVVAKAIFALSFSRLPIYNKTNYFLHCALGKTGKTVIASVVALKNLVVTERHLFEFVPGQMSESEVAVFEKLATSECPVYVFDDVQMRRVLMGALGPNHTLPTKIRSLRDPAVRVLPRLRGFTLDQLAHSCPASRYSLAPDFAAVDTLIYITKKITLLKNPTIGRTWQDNLDLVAISTVADIMNMNGENHLLVRLGLGVINSEHCRKQVMQILTATNIEHKQITESDIAWTIAPAINSMGRMGIASKAVNLFLASPTNCSAIKEGVLSLIETNTARKERSAEIWRDVAPDAASALNSFEGKFIYLESSKVDRGFTGAMASKFEHTHHVPSIIVAVGPESAVGSMRSTSLNVKDFLGHFSDLFSDYGGHPNAGGFSVPLDNLEEFRFRVNQHILEYEPATMDELPEVDMVLPAASFTHEVFEMVEFFEPYGQGNPELTFLLRSAHVNSAYALTAKNAAPGAPSHLKFAVSAGRNELKCMFWEHGNLCPSVVDKGNFVNIMFNLKKDYWHGNRVYQASILDAENVSNASRQ